MTRIKTLHPTINNISDPQIPIPIETVYFLEDGERDKNRPNRYWFNFPAEWSTANIGESIVGVRNIYTLARRRKLEFDLSIRKYLRSAFDALKANEKNINKTDDEIYDMLAEGQKGEVTTHIISWLSTDDDLRKVFEDIINTIKPKFDEYNKMVAEKYKVTEKIAADMYKSYLDILRNYSVSVVGGVISGVIESYKFLFKNKDEYDAYLNDVSKFNKDNAQKLTPLFRLSDLNRELNDIQMDGYYDYDKNTFIETLFSPINTQIDYYIENPDYIPTPTPTPIPPYLKVEDNVNVNLYNVDFKINFVEKNTDENYRRFDFADVMNIGNESFQNKPEQYQNKWLRRIDFINVWDRHSCKIYSSIAEQASHNYIGNSSVSFNPIKYYKLNSSDQKFWVEFYSGRHNNIPIVIPKNESFCIEMQFFSYRKLLYV